AHRELGLAAARLFSGSEGRNLMAARRLVRRVLTQTGLWPIVKYAHPKHHRPWLRLGLAKARARLKPAGGARLAEAYLGLADHQLYEDDLAAALASCRK